MQNGKINWELPGRRQRVAELMGTGISWRRAARILSDEWGIDINYDKLRLKARAWGIASSATMLSEEAAAVKPYTEFWRLEGDWMVCGDLELPFVSPEMVDMLLNQAKRLKIRRLLIAGDIFEFQQLGVYTAVVPPPHPKTETNIAYAMMDKWLDWFTEVRCLLGNHDCRVLKALEGTVEDEDVMAILRSKLGGGSKVHWTIYGYCLIDTPAGTWRFTHPKNYRKMPLSLSIELASKFRQHVCVFHLHRTAVGWHPDGKHIVGEIGCMCDPDKLAYRQLADSAYPQMTQSFAAVKDGRLSLFSPNSAWGCGGF